jgi:hypothetical protein
MTIPEAIKYLNNDPQGEPIWGLLLKTEKNGSNASHNIRLIVALIQHKTKI